MSHFCNCIGIYRCWSVTLIEDVSPFLERKSLMSQMNADRRRFVQGLAIGAAGLYVPGAFAEELVKTPSGTEGPFYPSKLPLDTDNDLLVINDSITPAVGQITHLSGRVLDLKGRPIPNAAVEIWQVDHHGVYLHPGSSNKEKADKNFQGFGRFVTNRKGEYYFRTVKPVAYPGRTPHIHVAVNIKGKRQLTTQMYIKGEPQNKRDRLLNRIKNPKQRAAVIREFKPIKGSKLKEVAANFDMVLGYTPEA